jgi:hypothetical protein
LQGRSLFFIFVTLVVDTFAPSVICYHVTSHAPFLVSSSVVNVAFQILVEISMNIMPPEMFAVFLNFLAINNAKIVMVHIYRV